MTMLMEPKDAAQLSCLRVVDGFELESLTKRGWKVVETIVTSEPVDIFVAMSDDEAKMRGQQYGNQSYFDGVGSVPYGMKRSKVLGSVCKYLIGQPSETAMEYLRNALDVAEAEARNLREEHAKFAQAEADREKEFAKLKKSHDVCSTDRDRHQTTVYELQAQTRKLEGDISRLRTALGDLRMKEILGGTGK